MERFHPTSVRTVERTDSGDRIAKKLDFLSGSPVLAVKLEEIAPSLLCNNR